MILKQEKMVKRWPKDNILHSLKNRIGSFYQHHLPLNDKKNLFLPKNAYLEIFVNLLNS